MADEVTLAGVRQDGSVEVLGTVSMPPKMKAREIAREYFGHFEDEDCSDGASCYWALLGFLDWLQAQGWKAPEPKVTLAQPGGGA
jgi:hypothetical protein